ncbi:uncharacterized protein BJ212DRAFT_68684 [Suillus subaureus]|uniref:Uncharacterized protein n=1 Tax=Suillus subaureus TaxID=48587 RepID=A0A9P7EEL8_9AGAM|nr:uncharacterized protein BJ212DRAFT_68684 [Suillus subaureus]KAG1819000.1 hypothetical protein BJ212DRAFT_68684 [Suillus subaureus]
MILTNFMRKNVNRKTKVTKSSGIPPRPHQSPSSSLSAPPEEILDIHEKSDNSRMSEELPPDGDSSVNRPSTSTSRTRLNVGSSLVQLDYNPEPLDNWFPQELLSGRRGSHDSTWSLHMSPPPESAIAEATVLNTAKEDLNPGPTFQEAIIADISHSRQLSDCVVPFASKKSIPAPIFIPEVEMAPTKVPTRRPTANAESSGTNQQPFPTTSPPSPMDSENMSAISGTTLARALIRNSFILSSSDRGSRYRSGMARQDSATLPSGDRLLMEIALARDSGGDSIVPPVPSLPPGSGVLLLDQARTSAVQDKEQKFPDTSSSTMVSPSSGAYYASPDIIMHSGLPRRISRISEVPSPVPTTPMSPQSIRDARPMKSGSSIAASSVLARMDETDSDVPNTASHTPATTSSHRSFHQTGTGMSSTSIQSSEIVSHSPTDGLDGYHFVAPEPSQPTASTSSDVSAYLQTKSSDASLRRRRARALGTTPSLRGGRSFKASDVPSNSIFQRNKKHIRLPIGERPRSIIVPQTPNSPPLIASSTVQCPSALSQFPLVPTSAVPAGHIEMPLTAFAESDILNTSPFSATGIFAQRQHAECAFGISERVTYDLLDFSINASPKSQSSPTYPSSSSSTGEQTFPETPNIFTPLFSPNFPVPITALQLPGRPQAPRSATLPIPQEFVGMGALSRAMTLSVAPREEGSVGDNSSPTPWRPLSTVKSTPSPEPDPPEITSEVALVPASSTGQKIRTTDQNIEAAIPLQSSLVDPVICSPFYRESTSSDKLQGDEVLQALAPNFASSIPSIISQNSFTSTSKSFSLVEKPSLSPTSVPLPGSQNASPSLPYTRSGSISSLTSPSNSPGVKPPFSDPNFQPSGTNLSSPGAQSPNRPQLLSPQPQAAFPRGISSAPDPLSQRPESESHVAGTSFLPSVSPPPPSTPPRSPLPPSFANLSPSLSPSFIAPPSYHSVISNENDMPLSTSTSGGASSQETGSETNFIIRPPSISATPSLPSNIRSRTRARPPLPIGPRKPSGPIQPLGSFVPGIRERNGSVSSMGSGYAHGSGSGYAWRKLTAAASTPAPKFQTPPSRWRGMTLEAAQWTLTQHELQTIVSRAIKQSAEASSIRLLRTEMLDVDIPEEVHRLEMQRTDVKTRYKMLVRKRWQLMGTLAGHLDGPDLCDPMTAARTVEELSEVSIALDQLTDELHTTVEQLGQLKSLRDVHSASALAVALRKVNTTFLKQVAESQKLREQIDSMEAERDEAWKQAEDVAQDFDNLSDQVRESRGERVAETAALRLSGRRSARISAVRKSSIRQSKAGLRSVSKSRSQRSSMTFLRSHRCLYTHRLALLRRTCLVVAL